MTGLVRASSGFDRLWRLLAPTESDRSTWCYSQWLEKELLLVSVEAMEQKFSLFGLRNLDVLYEVALKERILEFSQSAQLEKKPALEVRNDLNLLSVLAFLLIIQGWRAERNCVMIEEMNFAEAF